MVEQPDDRLTLTDAGQSIEAERDDCEDDLPDAAEPLFEANVEQTQSLVDALLAESEYVPGEELADDADANALRQYVDNHLGDYWFAELNARGSDADLQWREFTSAVRLFVEWLYLQAFERYRDASNRFSELERVRTRAERRLDDVETRLQRDDASAELEDEDPLESLVADAKALVTDAGDHLDAARDDVLLAHGYYAISECFRDEYDVEASAFEYVSLADDSSWYFQDLRHRRDRLATRVDWLRRDLSALVNRL